MSTRRPTLKSRIFMVRQFIQDRHIASIKATSPYLVQRICGRLDLNGPRVVVEFGPGLGCFTHVLLDRLSPDSTLILIESNPEFAARLRGVVDPRLRVVEGNALQVRELLAGIGVDAVDAVLSGIPFSYYPEPQKLKLLRDTRAILRDGGVFVAYQSTALLENPLKRVFGRVRVERELFHIPPLAVLEARAS